MQVDDAAGQQPDGALYGIAVTLPGGEAVEEVFELEAPAPARARRRAAQTAPPVPAPELAVAPSSALQTPERVVAGSAF